VNCNYVGSFVLSGQTCLTWALGKSRKCTEEGEISALSLLVALGKLTLQNLNAALTSPTILSAILHNVMIDRLVAKTVSQRINVVYRAA